MRREQLLGLCLLAALFASVAAGLLVRVPDEAGLGFSLARHGPHLLLALAVGAGFGVAGAVQTASDPTGSHHPLLLAISTGAAFGGMLVAGSGRLGVIPGFALGAAVGALAFAGVVSLARRTPGGRRLVTGFVLLAMLGAGLFAGIQAKGDPTGLRPLAWWLLGDLSRARWITAVPIALVIAGLAATLVRRIGPAASFAELDAEMRAALEGRAALLFGLCLGAAGLVSFFALIVALAARTLLGHAGLRAGVTLAAILGALAMVWADSLPPALFGGLAPPLGLSVALVAIPWFWLRNDGGSSRPVRAVEIGLGIAVALAVGLVTYVLHRVAAFIA